MRRIVGALLLALSFARCGGVKLLAPPAVFPMKVSWSVPIGGPIEGELATDGRLLFVSGRDGSLRALDPEHGGVVWQLEAPAARLTAVEGVLVARHADGTLVRHEPESGIVRWRTTTGIDGAMPAALAGEWAFVSGKRTAAVDRESGHVVWTSEDGGEAWTASLAVGSTLVTGERDGTLRAREIASGRTLWTFRTGSELLAAPISDEKGRIYFGTTSRRFLAVSLDDGDQDWRWKVGADVQTSAAVLGSGVIFGTNESVLYSLNRRNGNMRWRTPLPSRPRSRPLLMGSAVIVACYENEIMGYDGRTGRRLGSMKVASTIATEPLVIGKRLFVGLRDRGTVAAIDVGVPRESPTPSPSASASGSAASPSGSPTPSPGVLPSVPTQSQAEPSLVTSPSPEPLASPSPSPAPTPTPTPRPTSSSR